PMLAKGETGLLAKLFEGTLQPLTMKLLLLMLLLFVLLYIVYVIIQGPAWYLASKIADQQSSLGKYLATFAKLNLLWLLFFVIIKMLDITLGLRYQLIKKFSPLALNVSAPIVTVLFVILGIIVFTSYGRLRALEFLKIPFLRMIGMLFVCVVLFLVLWFIIDLFASAPFEARVLVQIIFLPIFVLVRTYSIRVVNSS
ncbi:MAG TPA: hypothetical protein VJJ82_00745, partial [Candidatus Nanoarchaeia archaeon]|nr:hypothetical protein [Candidatus Nanoarchaeia archaeon]